MFQRKRLFINICLLSILLFIQQASADNYTLVLASQENKAACLDGSPPGIYVHEGSGEGQDKFLVYFEGGGFCGGDTLASTIESCYQRSSTNLGTTKNYQKSHSFDGHGLLSTKKQQNQNFYNWNKIYVIYCDGSSHQGFRQAPIVYKGKNLYFRGSRNSQSVFEYLDTKYDFYNQNKIVITGVSAGGLGTYEWTNYLHDNTKTSQVYSIPDSGVFITDYYSPIIGKSIIKITISNLLQLIGGDEIPEPIQKCLVEFDNDFVACFNPANYAKYLKPPMLIINSPYDYWALENILVVKCITNRSPPYSLASCNDTIRVYIEEYHDQSLKYLQSMKNGRSNVGIWGPACVQHGFSISSSLYDPHFKAATVNGQTLSDTIKKFLEDPDNAPWLIDQEVWPNNTGCNGIQKFLQRQK